MKKISKKPSHSLEGERHGKSRAKAITILTIICTVLVGSAGVSSDFVPIGATTALLSLGFIIGLSAAQLKLIDKGIAPLAACLPIGVVQLGAIIFTILKLIPPSPPELTPLKFNIASHRIGVDLSVGRKEAYTKEEIGNNRKHTLTISNLNTFTISNIVIRAQIPEAILEISETNRYRSSFQFQEMWAKAIVAKPGVRGIFHEQKTGLWMFELKNLMPNKSFSFDFITTTGTNGWFFNSSARMYERVGKSNLWWLCGKYHCSDITETFWVPLERMTNRFIVSGKQLPKNTTNGAWFRMSGARGVQTENMKRSPVFSGTSTQFTIQALGLDDQGDWMDEYIIDRKSNN